MQKLLKWLGISFAGLLVLLILGIALILVIIPLDKIKDFAAAKISETIGREVQIEKVSFAIFSGIKLEGLTISEQKGFSSKYFVKADGIELRYAFWPLFSRQLLVKEIRLVRPEIVIEKNRAGMFNFSDLTKPKNSKPKNSQPKKPTDPGTASKPPVNLLISAFSIKEANLKYYDRGAGTFSEVKNFNLSLAGFELALVKPLDLRASATAVYQGKDIPVGLQTRIGLNLAEEKVSLAPFSLSLAGEELAGEISVGRWKQGPDIVFSLHSKGIVIDPLLALFAGTAPAPKAKLAPGELTKNLNSSLAALPRTLSVKGELASGPLTFQAFKIDGIKTALQLQQKRFSADLKEVKVYGGVLAGKLQADLNVPGLAYQVNGLKLSNFNAQPFCNALVETFLTRLPDYLELRDKVHGQLDLTASLRGRGVEPADIMANLKGEATLSLKNGELKKLKTLAEVGKVLRSGSLQDDLKVGLLSSSLSIANQVVTVRSFALDNPGLKLGFQGGVDLKQLRWVAGNRLNLKLPPATVKDLPREFAIFKDKSGWLELTFELTGELKKPFPKPILDKPIEAVIDKVKIKIDAKKVEIEQKIDSESSRLKQEAEAAAKQKASEETERLKREAADKLKELIKF
jgi:uncharacterized protein involved in outer membrane biogenesis